MDKKEGILLINLGTPSDITAASIKQYLTEFLHDRHVVDLNPLLWYPILHGIILPKRVPYIANHYKKIWINNQSPLLHYSKLLRDKLQTHLPNVRCELAMTYGQPSLSSAVEKLKSCQKITILPMFPQYSTTTTQAVFDKLTQLFPANPIITKADHIRDYADHPYYIEALYLNIKQSIIDHGKPEHLLLSYHGIPLRYIEKRADDYSKRCKLTTELLTKKLKENGIDLPITMVYQSKFGRGKWTSPNITDLLKNLALNGIKHIQVICPGFAVDCIETIYEINEQNREFYLNAGGKTFHYIPALNDSDLHIKLLLDLISHSK